MGMLTKPTFSVAENIDSCVTRVVKANFGKHYASVRKKMITDEASYIIHGRTQKMHLFSSSPISEALGDKARALYDNRMVHKSGTGRANYAKLRMITDICPYCLERSSETLDHYLPKSSFPLLSITPANLIPSCETCNRKKLDDPVLKMEDQFVHPYFETLFGFIWLSAKVCKDGAEERPRVVFSVKTEPSVPTTLAMRIAKQFERLELSRLYSIQAGVEINSLRLSLEGIFRADGGAAVKSDLSRQEKQWSDSTEKVWKAVMFRALARSRWFCFGGFRNAKAK
jgi:hypothetical protein